jgi:hypothetical protein
MSIHGDAGIAIKTALLSGLRVEELAYTYNQQICKKDTCDCKKLHVIQKPNGLPIVIVNWFRRQKKCYLAIMPSRLWDNFRGIVSFSEGDTKYAESVARRIATIDFDDIRKMYYSVMQGTMAYGEIQVLTGRATMDAAIDCMTQLESLSVKYYKAWEKCGIILPVL